MSQILPALRYAALFSLQFLCESVTRYLNSPAPKLPPLIPISTINSTSAQATPTNLGLEVREVTGALFLLGELWGVEVDVVRRHLVTCLFAAGLGDRGTEVCVCVCMYVCVSERV